MKKNNILVTGALGHIGSRLIREYSKREDVGKIILLDNLSTQRYCSLFNLSKKAFYSFVEGDVRDLKVVKKAIKGNNIVLHLAAITDAPSTLKREEETMDVNLGGTVNVLEASLSEGVERFIFPSTTSVYGEAKGRVYENTLDSKLHPSSPYAKSKLLAEKEICKTNGKGGLETIILRNGTIFGVSEGMRFHTAINKFVYQASTGQHLTIWNTALKSKRPYLGLGDAIRAMQFFEKKGLPGETYNVLTDNFSMKEIIDSIKKIKPEVEIEITESPLLNQKPYEVSKEKLESLGFVPNDNLDYHLRESFRLFESIRNL